MSKVLVFCKVCQLEVETVNDVCPECGTEFYSSNMNYEEEEELDEFPEETEEDILVRWEEGDL